MRQRRVVVIFGVAVLLFAVVAWRLVQLQLLQHDLWLREAIRDSTRVNLVAFERGRIFDRLGELLAQTEEQRDLIFVYRDWRRGTVAGRTAAAWWTLGAAWRPPTEARDHATLDLAALGAVRVGDVSALEPRSRRSDLVDFYLKGLFGPPFAQALRERLGRDVVPVQQRFDELPGFTEGLERGRAQAAAEEQAWELLTQVTDAPLDELTDQMAGRHVARMARELETGPELRQSALTDPKSYARLKELQREFEGDVGVLVRDLPYDAVTLVGLRGDDLSGLSVRVESRRSYPAATADVAPLLIGRVSGPLEQDIEGRNRDRIEMANLAAIDEKTTDERDDYERLRVVVRELEYRNHEQRGRGGVEGALEEQLRGKRGWSSERRTASGEIVSESVEPLPGLNVDLTLDVDVQRACEEVLDAVFARPLRLPGMPVGEADHWAGAIVLLDARDGAVLAAATGPRPTREQLSTDWSALAADPWRPLSHRAVSAGRSKRLPPPGSTFKPLSALAALTAGAISPQTTFVCNGGLDIGDRRLGCLGHHGEVGVVRAIASSCNVFFYQVGAATGADVLADMARVVGLGRDLTLLDRNPRLERHGVPCDGAEFFEERTALAPGPYNRTDAMLLAIGQHPLDNVTPLQVAAMMGAVGTGHVVTPYLVRAVEERILPAPDTSPLAVSQAHLALVRRGMERVVDDLNHGTARLLPKSHPQFAPFVAAKTGTAEVGGLPDQSWFAGYMPREDPRLAFAVLIEDCGLHGSEAALPVFLELLSKPAFARFLEEDVLPPGAGAAGTAMR